MNAARDTDHRRRSAGSARIMLLTGLVLAGCAHDRLPAAGPAEFASEALRIEHEIRFAEGGPSLSPIDRERLIRFLADADPNNDGLIVISVGRGQGERLMYLQALLRSGGRQASGTVDPHQPENRAVMSVEQDLALPTRCTGEGLWDSDIANDSEGLPLGCTTSKNLAAMIDDPEDLTHGRPLGPAAAAPAADLARAYLSRFADPLAGIPDVDRIGPTPDGVDEKQSERSPEASQGPGYE